MSTASSYLTVSGISVDVEYKDIKHLHIGVYPPVGRVRVAAPTRLNDDAIRLAVVKRLPWIRQQQQQLREADRQSERQMVTGESHYLWGKRYRLRVEESPRGYRITPRGSRLVMAAPAGSTPEQRRAALDDWYRSALKQAVPPLLEKWEAIIGLPVQKWTVRRMRTKWGTCNQRNGHLTFNLELAKKDPSSLEYLVVHEMTHLHERGHGERFIALMDSYLPTWRAHQDVLNATPLREEDWHNQPHRHAA